MAERLFTFGCSFTNYHWATWADLALDSRDGENWGSGGAGNKFIFESLIECDIVNKISKDDTVVIMWSSFTREDRYIDGWQLRGNVYNARPLYDKEFIQKYWCDHGAVLNNLNFICAAIKVLNGIGCKWRMASMLPFNFNREDAHESMTNKMQVFKHHLDFIESYKENWCRQDLATFTTLKKASDRIWSLDINDAGKIISRRWIDPHPFPLTHYSWLIEELPELNSPGLDLLAEKYNQEVMNLSEHPNVNDSELMQMDRLLSKRAITRI